MYNLEIDSQMTPHTGAYARVTAFNVIKESLNGALTPFLCNRLADKQRFYAVFANTFLPAARRDQYFGSMGAMYNLLCNRVPPNDEPLPFNGGQCPVQYHIEAVGTLKDQSGINPDEPLSNSADPFGPIVGVRYITGNLGLNQQFVMDAYDGGGRPTVYNLFGTGGFGYLANCSITSVVRVDGNPDNCGNPARPVPAPPDPGWNIGDTTITYTNSDGVDVTIPISFIINNGYIDINAQVNVPVTVNIDNKFDVQATVNFSTGAINFSVNNDIKGAVNFNTGGIGSGNVITIGDPPSSSTDPQEGEPDPRDDRAIVGVLVTVTSEPTGRATVIGQADNPDIYAPRLGNINFLCRIGSSLSGGWTGDIPVKNRRHLIPCPWKEGAVDVKGTPEPGVEWVLTPVYAAAQVPLHS